MGLVMGSSIQSVSDPKGRLETILERALTAYQRDERHGGAERIGERLLDAELVPIAREAFRDADHLPSDHEVLSAIAEPMQLVGEGYHVIALAELQRRFVVKYAKHQKPVPPLAAPMPHSRHEWQHEHGIRTDGSLHPAIWQHIHAFEAYGPLAVPRSERTARSDAAAGAWPETVTPWLAFATSGPSATIAHGSWATTPTVNAANRDRQPFGRPFLLREIVGVRDTDRPRRCA